MTWNRKGDFRPWDKIKQDQNVRNQYPLSSCHESNNVQIKFLTYNQSWWDERKKQVAAAAEKN